MDKDGNSDKENDQLTRGKGGGQPDKGKFDDAGKEKSYAERQDKGG